MALRIWNVVRINETGQTGLVIGLRVSPSDDRIVVSMKGARGLRFFPQSDLTVLP
jgi:hypothetical protein